MKSAVPLAIYRCPVKSVTPVKPGIFALSFESPELSERSLPGQFVNVKVSSDYVPLLRRPFSVHRTEARNVELIFNAIGPGTLKLADKRIGDMIDVLGPLGRPFSVDDDFETALLVGGGLGIAPLPILTDFLRRKRKPTLTFVGARTAAQVVDGHLENVHHATDDGSVGFRGTVVELLAEYTAGHTVRLPKIFACGPLPMLKTLGQLAAEKNIACEASFECTMACGFGICQGCPIERVGSTTADKNQSGKYALVCKDGPVFNTREVIIR